MSDVLIDGSSPDDVTGYHSLQAYLQDDTGWQLADRIRTLLEWDAWPTLENAWDLIPFSFVVDWFGNVSEILDSVDANFYASTLAVREVLSTTRLEIDISGFLNGNSGKIILYQRVLDKRLPYVKPQQWTPSSPSFINLIDGTSLIVEFL
jgi:hypothetical protein